MALHAQLALGFLALALSLAATAPSVSQQISEYAPNYGTPIACGASTHASEVFVAVSSTAYGPAPQTDVAVYHEGSLLWDERDEPGGFRLGRHEDDWYRQPFVAGPGRYTFEVYVYDNHNVPRVRCDVTKV